MTKTAIGLSGGLDSAYALWKILSTTNEEVTAYIIKMEVMVGNKEIHEKYKQKLFNGFMFPLSVELERAKVQNSNNIANWLKTNVRDFNVVEVDFDVELLNDYGDYKRSPPTYLLKLVLDKLNSGEIDKLVIPHEKENDGHSSWSQTGKIAASKAAYDMFVKHATRGTISFPLLDYNYHQGYAFSEMPQELIDLTNSCEISDPACGVCFKCSKRKFFLRCIADGMTMQGIADFIDSKYYQVPDKWMSMKVWLHQEIDTYDGYLGGGTDQNEGAWEEMPQWGKSYTVPTS